MLFNSNPFLVFLPVVFFFYWFVFKRNVNHQNLFVLTASLLFYGWWDWRFLFLMLLSAVIDYFCGLNIHQSEVRKTRRLFVTLSILSNLTLLGFFKYYNFFIDSLIPVLGSMGFHPSIRTLNIILPVGISFYTFQTISYSLDIYRRKLQPTHNFITFFTYVSYFPQLVAGPIERGSNLLPQLIQARKFNLDLAMAGSKLILYGLFKKVVIADSLAPLVDEIFSNYQTMPSSTLVWGTFMFAFQIYGDFSGYSDIAIGTSKLFGIELMSNFKFPYFSRDIAEFWRRWHISLSTWFRDYIYVPLGGSKHGKAQSLRNIGVIFLVSGFWHGANWTFLIWGGIHALLFLPLFLFNLNRRNVTEVVAHDRMLPSLSELFQMGLTFLLVCFAWIFFRAPDVSTSIDYISRIFHWQGTLTPLYGSGIFFIVSVVFLDWQIRRNERFISFGRKRLDYVMFLLLGLVVFYFWTLSNSQQDFIYFQF